MKQKTIGDSFSIEGIGLHTGIIIHFTAHPAAENHGIKIRRTDLEDQPEVNAIAENVGDTRRGTVLKCEKFQVSTVEHALAALYAFGINNCLIEVDGPEFPILDGSSKFYVEELKKTGVSIQDANTEYLIVDEMIELCYESGSYVRAYPSDKLTFEVEIGFNSSILPSQTAKLDSIEHFADEISAARTFVFVREIEPLLQADLIKGGDLKNAIVIYDQLMPQERINFLTKKLRQPEVDASELGYLSGPLNFENEPARHKLLDLVGDLSLTGKALKARIVAKFPGHKINTEFAHLLRKKYLPELL